MILFIFMVILAYLMGSICSAILICKACSLPDPRTEGSKNPGATNVLRMAGKQHAALVMAADVLKGTIPVLIAKALGADPTTVGFTALAAVIGHVYPVFFEFKGGKGVATAIGALLGLEFIVGVMVVATWLLVAKFSRYSSLASITAIGLAPIYTLMILQRLDVFPPIFIMTLLILYKHRNNITRLIDKNEPKIKLKQNILEDVMEAEPVIPVVHKEEKTIRSEETEITKETVIAKPQKTRTASNKKTEESAKTTNKPAAAKSKTTKTKKEER